jgi:hypothetical protein
MIVVFKKYLWRAADIASIYFTVNFKKRNNLIEYLHHHIHVCMSTTITKTIHYTTTTICLVPNYTINTIAERLKNHIFVSL